MGQGLERLTNPECGRDRAARERHVKACSGSPTCLRTACRVPPNPTHQRAKIWTVGSGYWAIRRIGMAERPFADRSEPEGAPTGCRLLDNHANLVEVGGRPIEGEDSLSRESRASISPPRSGGTLHAAAILSAYTVLALKL